MLKKNQHYKDKLCVRLYFLKKYIELFGLNSMKRLEYTSNCKFSKVRNHVYSIGNFMLLYQALQTEQLLSSHKVQISNLDPLLNLCQN